MEKDHWLEKIKEFLLLFDQSQIEKEEFPNYKSRQVIKEKNGAK